ncbi:FtsK/SpoIIIE domain-containing protein [Arthrobacter wenxiniae]|uniref:FtsK domain-containing protein n=1 Tax=Arthrobacter wenxiniae TaxID=2713570 RepID=A0A7Y7IHH1_9MICC|nr:hypothetical protein [Arthrobacter wenxiniae]
MRLEITAVAGPGTVPFEPAELSISLPDGGGGQAVAAALHELWPEALFTVEGAALDGLVAGRQPLTDGAVVVVAPGSGVPQGSARTTHGPGAPAVLAVCSGPGAGAMFPLHRGSYSVGRGHCRIVVADPTLSRHHGTLTVGERGMTLSAEPGSAGFSILRGWQDSPFVAATPLRGTATIEVGDLIRCGMSGLAVRLAMPAGTGGSGGRGLRNTGAAPGVDGPHAGSGDISDRDPATPWGTPDSSGLLDASVLAPMQLSFSTWPPRSRWGALAAGLVPLASGVLLAWLTGSWMFLGFAAMGAVAILPPLLGGARQRRAFRASTAADAARNASRRLAAFPGADALMAAALGPAASGRPGAGQWDPGPRGSGPPGGQLAVRVGTAAQRATSEPVSGSPPPSPPEGSDMPVAVELGPASIQISGPLGPLRLLLHFVLMQLDSAGVPVVLWGPASELPLPARFLPRTVLAGSQTAAAGAVHSLNAAAKAAGTGPDREGSAGGGPGWTAAAGPGVPACVLVSFLAQPGVLLAQFPHLPSINFSPQTSPGGPGPREVQLHPAGNGAVGHVGGLAFVPDGVPAAIFDRYARSRGASGKKPEPEALPLGACCVPPPQGRSPEGVAQQWRTNLGGPLRPVPVGRSPAGHEMFSFVDDGPHLLVGGTTGSGKSEFLRTLVGGLAAAHSPTDLQFILVDFKGGAGLGPLRKFPHTSALVTDLDGGGLDRLLASLRAEVHRREAVLGRVESADANTFRAGTVLPGGAGMAHLVIVIDEFRVLVDQYPDAMNQLMRLAAVGRSLGIHLVMATQRPQGAISPDIRANVTSSVCLRVQTTYDSQDVIGSAAAAFIAVDTPGRAYISRAGGRPTPFQSATLRLPAPPSSLAPRAVPAADLLRAQAADAAPGHAGGQPEPAGPPGPAAARAARTDGGVAAPSLPESDIDAVAGVLAAAWQMLSGPPRPGPADAAAAVRTKPDGPPWPDQDTEARPRGNSNALAAWTAAPAVVAPELPRELDLPALPGLPGGDAGTGDAEDGTWARIRRRGQHAAVGGRGEDAVLVGMVDVPERQSLEPLTWSPSLHSHVACVGTRAASSSAVGLLAARLLDSNAGRAAASRQHVYILDGDGSMENLSHRPGVGGCATPAVLRTAARLLLRLSEVATSTEAPVAVFVSDWGRWVAAFRSSPWPWAEDSAAALVRHCRPNVAVVLGGDRELLTAPFMAAVPNRMFLPFGASAESRLMWPPSPRSVPLPGRAVLYGPMNAAAARGAPDEPHLAQLGRAGQEHRGPLSLRDGRAATPPVLVRDLPESLTLDDVRRAMSGLRTGAAAGAGTSAASGTSAAEGTGAACALALGLGGDCGAPISILLAPGAVLPVLGGPGSGKSTFMAAVRELNRTPECMLWADDATMLQPEALQAISRALAAGRSALVAVPNHLPTLARLPLEWGLRTAERGIVLRPARAQDGELFGLRLDTAGSEPPGRAVLVDRGRTKWFQFPFVERGAA